MKLKNFAFFGVMASILTISGAYAADGTIIASKGYVDTNFQANNRYQIGNNSWAQVASADKTSDAKYPSMKTLTAAVGNGVSSVLTQNVTDGDTTHAPSSDAVHDAINNTVNNIDMSSKVDVDQTAENADTVMLTNASGKVIAGKVGNFLQVKNGEITTKYKDGTNIEIKDDGSINTKGLATVATSGNYNDLSNTPSIPTVNDATLTIQKNGQEAGTFTANAGTNKTINITVPTKTSDLTNNSGFLTSADIRGKVDVAQSDEAAKNGFLMGNARGELNTFVGVGENMEIKEGKLVTKVTDTNTTYTGSNGITLTGTNFTNSGVRAVSESTSNGKITVDTNGTPTDVAVHGLKSAAYREASEFQPAGNYQAAGDYVLTTQGAEKTGQVMMTTGEEGKVTPVELGENLAVKEGKLTSVDTNTTYTGSNGITLSGTNFTNSGVRAVSESTSNGKITVDTNGTPTDVAVHGLKSAAYKDASEFQPAGNYQAAGDYVSEDQTAENANTVMLTDNDGKVIAGKVGKFLQVQNGEITTTYTEGENIAIDESGKISVKDLPTVNNATLTIKKNNTSVGTFTANSGTDASINIEVPTGALASKDTIKDADVASDAAIQYAKMSGDLKEITTNGAATCNAQNPCVLSYIGNNKYRWTNMDIAGLTVAE